LTIDIKELDVLAKVIIKVAENQTTTNDCRQVFQHAVFVGIAGLRNFATDDGIKEMIDSALKSDLLPTVGIEVETVQ